MIQKLLCKLGFHSPYRYWSKEEFVRADGISTKMRECLSCNKVEREYRGSWLKPRPKPKSRKALRR